MGLSLTEEKCPSDICQGHFCPGYIDPFQDAPIILIVKGSRFMGPPLDNDSCHADNSHAGKLSSS